MNYPNATITYKGLGTSNVGVKYIDYKGIKLDKTIKFTVKKDYFDSGDYIEDKNNSSSNRYFLDVNHATGLYLKKANGTSYSASELSGFTWSSSNTSIATASNPTGECNHSTISPKTTGNVTITLTDAHGNKKYFYITVYKAITTLTGNSTKFILGMGNTYYMKKGTDYTVSPSDATYQARSDFKWKSTNTTYATVGSTEGYVYGTGKGTTTIQAAPKPNYDTWTDIRTFEIVAQRIRVQNSSNPAMEPMNQLYDTDKEFNMVVGDNMNFRFYRADGTDIPPTGNMKYNSSTTDYTKLTLENFTGYTTVTAKAVGSAQVDFILEGDNGYVTKRWKFNVLQKASFPTGSYISYSSSYTSNSSSSRLRLGAGKTTTLYLYSSSGTLLSGDSYKGLTWSSSDTSIATVDPAAGDKTVVTGKKEGAVTITATDSNGGKRYFYLNIYQPITAINGKGALMMGKNCKYQLALGTDFTVTPSNATITSLTNTFVFKSSDETAVTVSSEGVLDSKISDNAGKSSNIQMRTRNSDMTTYTTVRTVTVKAWHAKCVSSTCTSATAMKSGDTATQSNTIVIDKGKVIDLRFEYSTSGSYTDLNSGSYVATDYDSGIINNVTNLYIGSTGTALQIVGNSTGTTTITITYQTSDAFFQGTYNVKVI